MSLPPLSYMSRLEDKIDELESQVDKISERLNHVLGSVEKLENLLNNLLVSLLVTSIAIAAGFLTWGVSAVGDKASNETQQNQKPYFSEFRNTKRSANIVRLPQSEGH